ncbi:MAG: hypothetical protein ACF8GE_07850 [Phycisphaerales bacterium JB043]
MDIKKSKRRWIAPVVIIASISLVYFHDELTVEYPGVTTNIRFDRAYLRLDEQELIKLAMGLEEVPSVAPRKQAIQALERKGVSEDGLMELATAFATLQTDGALLDDRVQAARIDLYKTSPGAWPFGDERVVHTFVKRLLDGDKVPESVLLETLPLLHSEGVDYFGGQRQRFLLGVIPLGGGAKWHGYTRSIREILLGILKKRFHVDHGYDINAWRTHIESLQPVEN